MEPRLQSLILYGEPSDAPPPAWTWVDRQLRDAGTYWVVPRGDGHPHPRPVWGAWQRPRLHLSIGSPVLARQLAADAVVTVHLNSGTDVVIEEGTVSGSDTDDAVLAAYNAKYDWDYRVDEYGALTVVTAEQVLAWRSAGWAGRDGFQECGRWQL